MYFDSYSVLILQSHEINILQEGECMYHIHFIDVIATPFSLVVIALLIIAFSRESMVLLDAESVATVFPYLQAPKWLCRVSQ